MCNTVTLLTIYSQIFKMLQLSKISYKRTSKIGITKVSVVCNKSSQSQSQSQSLSLSLTHTHHLKMAFLHSCYNIVFTASNMEPCAWVHESWIPALQHIVRIGQALSQHVQGITCTQQQPCNPIIITSSLQSASSSLI